MRTNIDIDDVLMRRAMVALNTRTKRDTVTRALERAVSLDAQKRLLELRGIGWEGDLEAMRLDR